MKNYVSETFTQELLDGLVKEKIYLVGSECGSGKTTAIMTKLVPYAKEQNKNILYLCNRTALKNQLDHKYKWINKYDELIETNILEFILNPQKDDRILKTDDFEEIIKQFLGYLTKANVTIIDLSGIPFEVLNISVSLISRLIFDFCFHYSKIQHSNNLLNDIPVLLVCEEAHNYIPRVGGAEYKSSRKSLERIAKEGRKYGLSLMVVSQRPSEVSETIFAQCNNFISLRLTNQTDQSYIKNLLPEGTRDIGSILPNLSLGECIIVGDSIIMPTVVKMEKPNPEPKSQSIEFSKEWSQIWKTVEFNDVIRRWRKEEIQESIEH